MALSAVFFGITGWGEELFNMPYWSLIITGSIGAILFVLSIVFRVRELKEEKEEKQDNQ